MSGSHGWRCPCGECVARKREYMRDYRKRHPQGPNQAARAWFDKTNAETRAAAGQHRVSWTRAEVDQALRTDVPVADLARQLGRSYSAVLHVRNKAARNLEWLEALPYE